MSCTGPCEDSRRGLGGGGRTSGGRRPARSQRADIAAVWEAAAPPTPPAAVLAQHEAPRHVVQGLSRRRARAARALAQRECARATWRHDACADRQGFAALSAARAPDRSRTEQPCQQPRRHGKPAGTGESHRRRGRRAAHLRCRGHSPPPPASPRRCQSAAAPDERTRASAPAGGGLSRAWGARGRTCERRLGSTCGRHRWPLGAPSPLAGHAWRPTARRHDVVALVSHGPAVSCETTIASVSKSYRRELRYFTT